MELSLNQKNVLVIRKHIPQPAFRKGMFVTVGIFRHITAGKENEFLAAQQAFNEAGKALRGFRERLILRDETSGALVELSIWESQGDFKAAGPSMMKYRAEQSRAGKDFSKFLDQPEELFQLVPIQSER